MSQRYQLGQTATLPRRADVQVLRALQQFQKANFDEIINHPVPIDMNTLTALKRSSLCFYLWLVYRTFALRAPLRLTWRHLYRQFGAHPDKASDRFTVHAFRYKVLREEDQVHSNPPKYVQTGTQFSAQVVKEQVVGATTSVDKSTRTRTRKRTSGGED